MALYLPAMWEAWAESLGQEDLLKEKMAIHSSIPAWRIPWILRGLAATVHGVHKEADTTEQHTHTHTLVTVNLSKPIGCSTSRGNPGTSPVVQWRRPPASTAGVTGSFSGRGTKILHSKWHGQKIFSEKDNEHNGERGIWSDGDLLM